jgi:hypothetical protein
MDSMRSLNTSLPPSRKERQQASNALLQAFKQAALSVTNLYKISASEQTEGYREGYQDALEDLLAFMDKGNIGLQDGEGWSVRQWATERWQGSGIPASHSESGDDEVEEEQRPRSSSPTVQTKPSSEVLQNPAQTVPANITPSPVRSESAPPPITSAPVATATREPVTSVHVPQSDFSFRATHQFPTVHDIDMDHSDEQSSGNPPTVQVNIIPRPSRNQRHNSHNPRSNNRSSNTFQLGPGAGLKRRNNQMLDFFDISSMNGKDGFGGGGKRGRYS